MASFYAVLFPLDVLDEIWDLIESVSEGILTYSWRNDFSQLKAVSLFSELTPFLKVLFSKERKQNYPL